MEVSGQLHAPDALATEKVRELNSAWAFIPVSMLIFQLRFMNKKIAHECATHLSVTYLREYMSCAAVHLIDQSLLKSTYLIFRLISSVMYQLKRGSEREVGFLRTVPYSPVEIVESHGNLN
jgi:hypothetical protein